MNYCTKIFNPVLKLNQMKKILVVSDTHFKSWNPPDKLKELMESADLIVHAGDFDTYDTYRKFAEYELVAVAGDSDDEKIREELPKEVTFSVEGVKFGVVHKGNYLHQFHDLGYKAMEMGVNFLIFGHVHRFVLHDAKKAVLLCPGSPSQPRLSAASCAELTVDGCRVEVRCHVVQNLFCGMDVLDSLRKLRGCDV